MSPQHHMLFDAWFPATEAAEPQPRPLEACMLLDLGGSGDAPG